MTIFCHEAISKHTGVISFFDKEFVRTGIFPKEYSRMLHFAFDRRQINDYGELSFVDQDEAEVALNDAKIFVGAIEVYLRSELSE